MTIYLETYIWFNN